MLPYYQDSAVTLYHGDSRDLLPEIAADVCITDPPWELKSDLLQGSRRALALWAEIAPLIRAPRILLWLPIHADPRPWLGPIDRPYLRQVYLRRVIPGYFGRSLLDGEVIHCLGTWPSARAGRMVIPGGLQVTYVENDRLPGHPANRSLRATRWLVEWWSDPGDLIMDPFAGSGTTLRAAKDLGRRGVGIEIDRGFCHAAARALAQECLGLV